MKEYLESLIKPLLTKPEALLIEETQDDRGTLLAVSITKPDMGRIIGKGGETINAVRTLVHTLGSTQGIRVSVKILEPVV